ncbi:hypothetical protein [Flavobacterium rhizosphaerae]|uniref:Uncharacterized protein n=1 Tax=Flavobacterium rhizosphaerae TaxID=3163298 RepID=A0ABW8YSP0_9FLAO
MSEFVSIGSKITVASIREYLFANKIEKGDSLIVSPADYEHLIEDSKRSGEPVQVPLNILGVLLVKDNTGNVPVGKLRIVKNEKI